MIVRSLADALDRMAGRATRQGSVERAEGGRVSRREAGFVGHGLQLVRAFLMSAVSTGRGRSAMTAALLAAAVMLLAVPTLLPLTREIENASAVDSPGIYLSMAVNHALCGRYAELSGTLGPFSVAKTQDRPIALYAAERGGSVDAYCAGAFQPWVMNEISLAILEGYLLRLMPDASLPQLATALAVTRVAMIGFFVFVMLWAGASIVLTLLCGLLSLHMTLLFGGNALFSHYPFMLPTVLCFTAGCATLAAWLSGSRWLRSFVLAAALGFAAGFAGNLRTTLYPMVAAAFFLAVADHLHRSGFRRRSWITSVALVAVFIGSVLAFEATFISPMRKVAGVANYAHHTVAHPLVLGLASPPNELAEREGIEWDDRVGPKLAQRIDPSAAYLSPAYEPALWTYYAKLWFYHPREMAQLYVAKWRLTGRDALEEIQSREGGSSFVSKATVLKVATWPVALLSSLIGLPQVLLSLAVAGVFWGPRMNVTAAVLLTSLSAIAFLGYVEAAVVLGAIALGYSAVLLTIMIIIGLLAYQVVFDGFVRRFAPA